MCYLKINRLKSLFLFVSILLTFLMVAQPHFTLDVNRKGVEISPSHCGVFFEDINYAADGGLYAELVQNLGFEYQLSDKSGYDPLWNSQLSEISNPILNLL